MAVRRIVSNIHTDDPTAVAAFYSDVFNLDIVMDMGWIATLAAPDSSATQLSLARHGGSDTDLPALSIEVDDLNDILDRLESLGIRPEYGPTNEDWGVRRFYFRDPAGTLINVLTHIAP